MGSQCANLLISLGHLKSLDSFGWGLPIDFECCPFFISSSSRLPSWSLYFGRSSPLLLHKKLICQSDKPSHVRGDDCSLGGIMYIFNSWTSKQMEPPFEWLQKDWLFSVSFVFLTCAKWDVTQFFTDTKSPFLSRLFSGVLFWLKI